MFNPERIPTLMQLCLYELKNIKGKIMFFGKKSVYFVVAKGRIKALNLNDNKSTEIGVPSMRHPRTPMNDFLSIERAFKQALNHVAPQRFFSMAPTAYVHLIEQLDGGYTDVEVRAFKEAILGAGARDVYMPDSPKELNREQLLQNQFVQHQSA